MKLAVDVAAEIDVEVPVKIDVRRRARTLIQRRIGWKTAIAFVGSLSMLASPALGLDGIDLSNPVEAPAAGECPKLIQIKYPFLSCRDGQIGLADGNATWENSRQIPEQSRFIEGIGYWGDRHWNDD